MAQKFGFGENNTKGFYAYVECAVFRGNDDAIARRLDMLTSHVDIFIIAIGAALAAVVHKLEHLPAYLWFKNDVLSSIVYILRGGCSGLSRAIDCYSEQGIALEAK
jgi:hypothetical protein